MPITSIMYYTEYAEKCQYKAKNSMKTIINIYFIIHFKRKKAKKRFDF